MSNERSSTFDEQFRAVSRAVDGITRHHVAAVEVDEVVDDPRAAATVVTVVPPGEGAATIRVYVYRTGDSVEVCAGSRACFVLRGESRDVERRVRALLIAVAEGRFTERLWQVDGKVVQVEGCARTEGGTVRTLHQFGSRSAVQRASVSERLYSPW